MRRMMGLFVAVLMVFCLCVSASAATNAPVIEINAVVSSDGSCRVTQIVTFNLEQAAENVTYPLPLGAHDITVNGTSFTPDRDADAAHIRLDRVIGNITGTISVTFSYTLDGTVGYNEDDLLALELPLLSGFAYPVESVRFAVTLPGAVENRPSFSSGYFKARIQEDMEVTVSGSRIEGRVLVPLKDRETLKMELMVDEAMFPPAPLPVWTAGSEDFAMAVCAVLALLYWLVFLRCLPAGRVQRAGAPDGIGAGELGSVMVMAGADLSMMVVSWAQMGYILMQLDNHGRILLHKRMDMGNERSGFENRIFKALFGRRRIIDGTGYHYAKLCRKVAAGKPNVQGMYHQASGNPVIFRILAALAGPFCGLSLGASLAFEGWMGTALTVVLTIFGGICVWLIQSGGRCLHLKNKQPLYVTLALCAVWTALGIWAGEPAIAGAVAAGEFLAGVMAAYGGRRTELGRQTLQQIYGLRHHLKTVSKQDLQRLMKVNPSYYYTMAPYALAFGVDKHFAKHFGAMRLSGCPYLTTGMDGHLTALEWSKLLRKAVDLLDARQKQLAMEHLLGK